jgi:hypothetical protein
VSSSQRATGDSASGASATAASDDVTAEQQMSYVQMAKAGYQEVTVLSIQFNAYTQCYSRLFTSSAM